MLHLFLSPVAHKLCRLGRTTEHDDDDPCDSSLLPSSLIPLCIRLRLDPAEAHLRSRIASMVCAQRGHPILRHATALEYDITSYLALGKTAIERADISEPAPDRLSGAATTRQYIISDAVMQAATDQADVIFATSLELHPVIRKTCQGHVMFGVPPNADFIPWLFHIRDAWAISYARLDLSFTTRTHLRVDSLGHAPYGMGVGDLVRFTFGLRHGAGIIKYACGATADGDLNLLVEGVTWMDVDFSRKANVFIIQLPHTLMRDSDFGVPVMRWIIDSVPINASGDAEYWGASARKPRHLQTDSA
jgi:hypothetical protein